jgi:hypothetical protein
MVPLCRLRAALKSFYGTSYSHCWLLFYILHSQCGSTTEIHRPATSHWQIYHIILYRENLTINGIRTYNASDKKTTFKKDVFGIMDRSLSEINVSYHLRLNQMYLINVILLCLFWLLCLFVNLFCFCFWFFSRFFFLLLFLLFLLKSSYDVDNGMARNRARVK